MDTPKLEQYPGYFPEGSKPFWTRAKVGVVAGVVGLIVGVAGVGGDPEADTPTASITTEGDDGSAHETELAQALEENSSLEDQLQKERADAEKALRAAAKSAKQTQRQAVQAAVAKVRQEERAKTAAAVQAAKSAAAAAAAASTPVNPFASSGGSTDPRFSYCYEANDAGFGPYYQGQDPEYDWYDDRDGDGVVCER